MDDYNNQEYSSKTEGSVKMWKPAQLAKYWQGLFVAYKTHLCYTFSIPQFSYLPFLVVLRFRVFVK